MGGVADPKIHAPPHMRYHVKFGSSATKGVHIYRKEPHLLGWGVTNPKTSPSHTCYHVKFGSSVSKGVCINERKLPNLGALGHCSLAVAA